MPTPAKGPSTRAAQAERTRQQILETAHRLFAELGYTATSLQMIADELGLTKAAVYYHFRAKTDILCAAMQPGLRRIATLLDEAAAMRGRRARIEHVASGYVDFLVEHRLYTVMASTDPDGKRHRTAGGAEELRLRGLALLFGAHPTGTERLAYHTMFTIPDCLPDLVDLTDEELREALRSTLLRILR